MLLSPIALLAGIAVPHAEVSSKGSLVTIISFQTELRTPVTRPCEGFKSHGVDRDHVKRLDTPRTFF